MLHISNLSEIAHAFDRSVDDLGWTHLLVVIGPCGHDVAAEVASIIGAFGAGLDGQRRSRVAGKAEHRFRVSGLQPHQACLLSSLVAGVPGVERARVEHQILRPSPSGVAPPDAPTA